MLQSLFAPVVVSDFASDARKFSFLYIFIALFYFPSSGEKCAPWERFDTVGQRSIPEMGAGGGEKAGEGEGPSLTSPFLPPAPCFIFGVAVP